jgi:hypothetical protein
LLLLLWILVFVVFYQAYPLKGFNYLLPVVPALSLLAGRALVSLASRVRLPATVGVAASFAAVTMLAAPHLAQVLADRQSAGLREAAHWIRDNSPPGAGVMTLSNGSAQYAFAFYAGRDSYPFGRFWLSTALPGGTIVTPHPPAEGTPRDWIRTWPPLLIESGTVSYLVFHTKMQDDPPEGSFVENATQRAMRKLIETYGGRLVFTSYVDHEPRAWVYQVTRSLPRPRITTRTVGTDLEVLGEGFMPGATATVLHRTAELTTVPVARDGTVVVTVPSSVVGGDEAGLVVRDSGGNHAEAPSRRDAAGGQGDGS